MKILIICIYVILSYWAVGKTIYANRIRVGKISDLFLTRLTLGIILGLVLIPVATLKTVIGK